ncbi:hypothetical protein C0J50_24073 [Silurus asotus]|uniref:Uncharacterized protein n=1 Tax=Silurus asotus TaxID=30991 RepID=A0AAD5AHR2_SILAS|nr:hypothetical protein C0J50_24073 [Silurus asotus]
MNRRGFWILRGQMDTKEFFQTVCSVTISTLFCGSSLRLRVPSSGDTKNCGEKETTLSLKMQLDESERRSEDLKKENVRLIQEREREDEERSGVERERQKQ